MSSGKPAASLLGPFLSKSLKAEIANQGINRSSEEGDVAL